MSETSDNSISRGKISRRSMVLLSIVICISFLGIGCREVFDVVLAYLYIMISEDTPGDDKVTLPAASTEVVSEGDSVYVAASAHAGGGNGTNWRTDLGLYARSTDDVRYRIELLKYGVNNTNPQSKELSIAAGTCLQLDDILASEFNYDGSASLRITPYEGRLVIASRTYNLLEAENPLGLPEGSTFGQFIPALGSENAVAYGEEVRLIQLSHNPAGNEGFRTNLGLVNTTGVAIRIETDFYRADGRALGSVVTSLAPFEYRQINSVLQQITSSAVDDAYAIVRTTTRGGGFLAYASVIDNLTGDPVAMMAKPIEEEPEGTPIYVVAAAHVAGAAGTNWRTDLEVHNPGSDELSFTIEMLRPHQANLNPQSASFTLAPGVSRRFEDVLESVFSFNGQAALRITPSTDALAVTSRTYNLLLEGNDLGLPEGSTFGQFIASESAGNAISHTDEGLLVQLSNDSASRTNLILVSTHNAPITIETDLFDGSGILLGTVSSTLEAYEYRQINRVFERVTGNSMQTGFAVVRTTTDNAAFLALASVIDNSTGDPVALPAARIAVGERKDPDDIASGLFDVFSSYQADETMDIKMFSSLVLDRGIDRLLDDLCERMPNATYQGRTLILDYGNGVQDESGNVISGSTSTDFSGLNIGTDRISGTIRSTSRDFITNGRRALTDWVDWTVGLNITDDGEVNGHLTVNGGAFGVRKSGEVSVSGGVDIDTIACLYYPTGGTITVIVDEIEYTYTFTPECDGTYDTGEQPGDTVLLNFDDLPPFTAVADQYPEARFSTGAGLVIKAFPYSYVSEPNSLAVFDGGELYEEPDTPLYIDFAQPVRSVIIKAWDVKTIGNFGRIRVYQGANLAGTVDLVGLNGIEEEALAIDLGAFLHVTRLELEYRDEINDTVFWDDLSFIVE